MLEVGCKRALSERMKLGLMLMVVSTMVRRRLNTGVAMLHKLTSSNYIQTFSYDFVQRQAHPGFLSLAISSTSVHRK